MADKKLEMIIYLADKLGKQIKENESWKLNYLSLNLKYDEKCKELGKYISEVTK